MDPRQLEQSEASEQSEQPEPKSKRLFNFMMGEFRSFQRDTAFYRPKDVPQDLQELSDEDVLNFCTSCCTEDIKEKTHNNITGLRLASWVHIGEGKSFLIERIAELPDADFHKMDFNVRYFIKHGTWEWSEETVFGVILSLIEGKSRDLDSKVASKLLRKLLALPQEIIKQLDLTGGSTDHYLWAKRFSLFFRLCALRPRVLGPKEKFDDDEWHHQFVYFISSLELNLSEEDLAHLNVWFAQHGGIVWQFRFYCQLNHLRQYEQSLRENPVAFEVVLTAVQREVEACSNLPVYPKIFILMWLVKLIDAYKNSAQPMPALRNQLLEQITLADCKNWRAKEIYYESRQMLADEYFTQSCGTLKQKLASLKMALDCSLQVWLKQPSSNPKLVWNIAMAFLFTNQKNLNRTPGFVERTPMLMWLQEDMQEVADKLPTLLSQDEQEKFITHVLDELVTQRNFVMPMQGELDSVRSELASERKDKLQLQGQLDAQSALLRQLSDQVTMLAATVAKMQGEKVQDEKIQESNINQEVLAPVSSSLGLFKAKF